MPASALARALRAYVRHAPGTLGKAQLVDHFLDEHLRTHPVHTTTRLLSGDTVPVTTSDVIQRFQYLFGEWEPNLSAFLRDRLRPGDTFIDVGAHRGAFSLLASHAVGPHGHVVAIEPHPQFHDDLAAAAAANRRTNIRTVRSAASDTTGVLTLYVEDPANLGHTTAVRPRHVHATVEVPSAPLADLVGRADLATTRVIKIDVEGAEAARSADFSPHSRTCTTTPSSSSRSPPGYWPNRARAPMPSSPPCASTASTRTRSPTTTTRPPTPGPCAGRSRPPGAPRPRRI
ncbi:MULTISPECIES: FkbM family methyltransferase [unclassified Streptomyces]|uniref:FkbM family methyltransferase n=1 Tax=unclassified Streptomyces TaxID=2593676 RepID=UPI000AD99E85|nr:MULTISPECIES: FkbM family methyltransferase [unclassified Streptomyces]